MELNIGLSYEDSEKLLYDKINELVVLYKLMDWRFELHNRTYSTGRSAYNYYFGDNYRLRLIYEVNDGKEHINEVELIVFGHYMEDHFSALDFSKALKYLEMIKESCSI